MSLQKKKTSHAKHAYVERGCLRKYAPTHTMAVGYGHLTQRHRDARACTRQYQSAVNQPVLILRIFPNLSNTFRIPASVTGTPGLLPCAMPATYRRGGTLVGRPSPIWDAFWRQAATKHHGKATSIEYRIACLALCDIASLCVCACMFHRAKNQAFHIHCIMIRRLHKYSGKTQNFIRCDLV